jgi:erythromycin esterase
VTDEIAAWLRANLHRLRTTEPDDRDDFCDLAPLRDIVGDARVVAIGESTHRIHEFSALRHRLTRFLVRELGFTAFAMESGLPEGRAVDEWVCGGPGDLDALLRNGITFQMGRCAEMRAHLTWMRAHNAAHERPVRFYGMDVSDSAASPRPAVLACLELLDDVDPYYAEAVRTRLLPLFGYLPADRTGLAWPAPALQAYLALEPAVRHEITARIGELSERMAAMRVGYAAAAARERVDLALRCAATARHTDAFLAAMAAGAERTYPGANVRDLAIAENVEWILGREDRIVLAAANGHVQRAPFHAPPIVNDPLTMAGQHLAAALGEDMVVIGTAFGGGRLWLHRTAHGLPPGHTEVFTQATGPFTDRGVLDGLLASAGIPLGLLDLRAVPATGPVADAFAAVGSIMEGSVARPLDPIAAFDAVVFVGEVSPWHTTVGAR